MIELRPHQAVEWDRLMEQRHIDVFWLRQQGATTFGLYVMAMHAAWEPGRYAWIAAGGQMARHAFHQLAKMLPDAGVTRTNRTLRLESATHDLENGSEVWVFRGGLHSTHLLRGRRWRGVVADGSATFIRPHDYAEDWSIRIL